MQALVFESTGDPRTVLQVQDVSQPSPSANEVLIAVKSCPIQRADLAFRWPGANLTWIGFGIDRRIERSSSSQPADAFDQFWRAIGNGTIRLPVSSTFPLELFERARAVNAQSVEWAGCFSRRLSERS